MATIILGQHADALTVRLTEGDGAELVATLVDTTGTEVDWTAAPTLSFAHSVTRDVIADHTATIAGPLATWDLTRADVDAIATGSLPKRAGQLLTYARITTPDVGDTDGHVEYAGKVDWRDGWTAGDRSQRVTFTLPAGGSSDALTIVNGGTVTLNDSVAEGALVGYRVKATATFEGEGGTADLEPGVYTFERTDTGWTYYTATGAVFGASAGPTEVAPQEPVWDDALLGYTIPTITGVEYRLAGIPVAAGFQSADAGESVTITAAPTSSQYVFPVGVATSWPHTFPAASPWETAFTDALKTPTGEFTSRAGWAVASTGTDPSYDHAVIDATGLYLTGGMDMFADTPVAAVKHFVETKYDYTEAENVPGGLPLAIRVSASWGFHQIVLSRASGAAALTWSGTAGWPDMAAANAANLTALPLTGTLRVENDGTYVSVFLNGALIAFGARNTGNNPGWAGDPNGYSIRLRGIPNTAARHRFSDVAMGTMP